MPPKPTTPQGSERTSGHLHDLPPLPERLAVLKNLLSEYGEPHAIPDVMLARAGYGRLYEEESGVTRLLPVEKLAEAAVEAAVKPEHGPPFEPIDMRVKMAEQYTPLQPDVLARRLQHQLAEPFIEEYSLLEDGAAWLPSDHPLNGPIALELDDFVVKAPGEEYPQAYVSFCTFGNVARGFNDKIERDLGHTKTDVEGESVANAHLAEVMLDELTNPDHRGVLMTTDEAENISRTLEKIRGRLTDLPVLEAEFEKYFAVSTAAWTYTETGALSFLPDEVVDTMVDPQQAFSLRAGQAATLVAEKGFTDIAESIRGAESLGQIRDILTKGIKKNVATAAFKAEENRCTSSAAVWLTRKKFVLLNARCKREEQSLRGGCAHSAKCMRGSTPQGCIAREWSERSKTSKNHLWFPVRES